MVESSSWKWNEVPEAYWEEQAEDVYYLKARWQHDGRKELDLGCGTGRHSLFFAESGFSVDAFDLSQSGIAILDGTLQERTLPIKTQVGDMLSLPYASGHFDCVLAFHVLYHTDRAGLERAVAEVCRVLAGNGEAYLTFNSLNSPTLSDPDNKRIAENTVIKTAGIEAGIPHHFVDEQEVRRLMSGFEIVRLKTSKRSGATVAAGIFVLGRKREPQA